MKLLIFLLLIGTCKIRCEDGKEIKDMEEDLSLEHGKGIEENLESTAKTKRGILNYGGTYPGYHGLTYSIPPVYYQKQFAPNLLRYPSIHKSFPTTIEPPYPHYHLNYHHGQQSIGQYAIHPGGATVTSYNINYPKYPIYTTHRPFIHSFNVAKPAIIGPVLPTSVALPQKPIIPLSIQPGLRIPILSQKPFIQQTYQFAQPTVHPFVSIQPQFFNPAPTQPTVSIPTTQQPIPLSGTNIFAAASPDGWHPIVVNQQPTPSPLPSTNLHRPSVSLLPPYGQEHQQHQQTLDVQFNQQQELNHVYLPPGDGYEQQQAIAHQQHYHNQDDYVQAHQQHAQLNSNEEGHGDAVAFNGQPYEQASNNGRYSGPSSYEVQLGSRTRNY